MPNWLCLAEADRAADDDRAVSLRPSRALRAQSGSSTPNPAPDSNGPVSRRNSSAPSVSSATWAGAASRSAPSSAGNSRAAAPSPASSSSSGCPAFCRVVPASQPNPVPVHTSTAGTIRLGSSADCSENSTRQPSSASGPPTASDGSISRKQVRTEPAGSAALASQSMNAAVRSLASRSSTGSPPRQGVGGRQGRSIRSARSMRARTATLARGQKGTGQPGTHRRIRQGVEHVREQRRRARCPPWRRPRSGRRAASRRRVRGRAGRRRRIAPAASGRRMPPSSAVSAGSTRPRATRSSANRATAAR